MASSEQQLQNLEGFERLDIGELYFLAGRTVVERGLADYRQFAVEELSWDGRAKRLTACVGGRREPPCEVGLGVRGGRLEHACECPAWQDHGGCKHVVAAAAAVFLAVQGRRVGGLDMPGDYARTLRAQLGYRDVADASQSEDGMGTEGSAPARSTELILADITDGGSLRFEIEGPIPSDFLRSVGITLPNDFGFYGMRAFHLGDPERELEAFARGAEARGVGLFARVDGQKRALALGPKDCRMRVVYDLRGSEVVRTVAVFDAEGAALTPRALIPGTSWILLPDGRLCRPDDGDAVVASRRGPLSETIPANTFNRSGWWLRNAGTEAFSDISAFRVEGEAAPAADVGSGAVEYTLDLSIATNAADEPEVLEFALTAEVDGCAVDLADWPAFVLRPILEKATGDLLSAKRRVRALLDLVRRVLADASERPDAIDFETYRESFPQLLGPTYRGAVAGMLDALLDSLRRFDGEHRGLCADAAGRRWLAYPFDGLKLAMLIFGVADAGGRKDLAELARGRAATRRGASGMGEVRRAVAAAGALGVAVRFNASPIRSEPLSISVETRAEGDGIDWFALHPTVRCGERTIAPDEWRRLVQGELLLEGDDGRLVMPRMDDAGEAGLRALAEMMGKDRAAEGGGEGEALTVSRLQMLDWIALRQQGVDLRLPPEAEALFASLTEFRGLDAFSPPRGFRARLRPYQSHGCAWIDFLYRHRFGACLADDMGLGKTVQAIGFLAKRFEAGLSSADGAPVLIVLPPSLVFNWLDEFERFAPDLKVVDCLGKNAWPSALREAQVVVTTYDRVRADVDELVGHRFEIAIFDEAHNMKNVAAARTQAAAKIDRRFTLCLTGTPVENNASEFYSVMTAAVPGIFGKLKDFKETYRRAPERVLGRSRPFILRRTKAHILDELPEKEEREFYLEMSDLQKEIYTRTVAEVRQEVAEAYEDQPEQQAGIVALAAILRLRQVCVSPELLGKEMPEPAPKFAHLADKLEELQAEGHAALVFSQFLGGLEGMETVASERGIGYLRMDGRTPVGERKELVRRFQDPAGPPFFFISLKTGGVGLNLTRANYVFHLDPWWNPSVENQASDRAHRIGQTRSVFVQRLIMQHSIEARMLELKERKAELFRRLVDDPGAQNARTGLSREDFEYLLNG